MKTNRNPIFLLSGVVVAAIALSSCGSAAEKATTQGDASSRVVAGGATPTASASTEEAPAPDAVTVEDYGFTQFPKSEFGPPTGTYGVVISNSGEQIATNVQVQIITSAPALSPVETSTSRSSCRRRPWPCLVRTSRRPASRR